MEPKDTTLKQDILSIVALFEVGFIKSPEEFTAALKAACKEENGTGERYTNDKESGRIMAIKDGYCMIDLGVMQIITFDEQQMIQRMAMLNLSLN